MSRQDRIYHLLSQAFPHAVIEVVDDSHKHKGHQDAPERGESHFTVMIQSPFFSSKNRVECHKLVYKSLEAEFTSGLHALSLKINQT
jgi:BolA protein